MTRTPTRTLAERFEQGARLRQKAARQKHADLHGPGDRDPVAILARADRTRVPELVPVRYERMLTSPFAFLYLAFSQTGPIKTEEHVLSPWRQLKLEGQFP